MKTYVAVFCLPVFAVIISPCLSAFFKDFPVVGQTKKRVHTPSPMQLKYQQSITFAR